MDLHFTVWPVFWDQLFVEFLDIARGFWVLSMCCINMLINLPAQFHLFIYPFFFVFSFISPRIFSLMICFLQVETSYHLVASTPEVALCFQRTFYPLCNFYCFSVSSWEGKLQNWNFSQYSRCYCTITVFYVLFCILFMNNFSNTVAFWVLLSCWCVKKGNLQVVFFIRLRDVCQDPSEWQECYRTQNVLW